jgi:hypothetical protein
MKLRFAMMTMAAVCSVSAAFGDVTFRTVIEMKFNLPIPPGALPPGFSGPTEMTARVKGTRSYSSFGKIASITDSSTGKLILLDADGKRFATTSISDYLSQVQQAAGAPTQQMPEEARKILEGIQFKVESHETGLSERIQGIDAAENEVMFAMTIPVPVPVPGGNGNGLELNGKFQVWKPKPSEMERVAALKEMNVYYDQSRQMGRDTASMMTKIFAMPTAPGAK